MEKQRTIKSNISLEGVGLHTGKDVRLELLPAPANTGIVFMRKDVSSAALIRADSYSVLNPQKFPRRTSVGTNGVYIHTIEHLMAALHILKIDNIQVNIWGEEIPGLDGSAKSFVEKIKNIGYQEQSPFRDYITIRSPIWVQEGHSSLIVLPSDHLRISYVLKYENSSIGASYIELVLNNEVKDNFYEARTFCLEDEVGPLLDMGLGKGSNYENTLVVAKDGIVKNKLRFPDEFIKHKVLDLIGDLYLAGPIQGHVIAVRSGHPLNIKLLDKLRRYKEKVTSGGVGSVSSYVPDSSQLSIQDIMKILPHRYPFLLVDKIRYLDKGKKAIGEKNDSINEHFFQGHFPGRPVMPGVLIIEAMAQVGGVLMLACEEHSGKLAYFMAANNIKFRQTVEPGDTLVLEVVAGKVRTRTGSVFAKAYVRDKVVAQAELMFALVDS